MMIEAWMNRSARALGVAGVLLLLAAPAPLFPGLLLCSPISRLLLEPLRLERSSSRPFSGLGLHRLLAPPQLRSLLLLAVELLLRGTP